VGAVGDGVGQRLPQDAAAGLRHRGGQGGQEQGDQSWGDPVEADLAQGGGSDAAGLDAAGDGVLVAGEGAGGPGAGGGGVGDPGVEDVAEGGAVGECGAVSGFLRDGLGEQVVVGSAELAREFGDRTLASAAAGLDSAQALVGVEVGLGGPVSGREAFAVCLALRGGDGVASAGPSRGLVDDPGAGGDPAVVAGLNGGPAAAGWGGGGPSGLYLALHLVREHR
jgi:DNA polymerase-3 subunit gamma/tau